ncbi:MAG: hypothetical protein BKP49_04990 [Treponema sp. CETP13]|nr:MAG: hypothetical protein BKP49_04990 [Treponema sp. CETP13]
MENRLYYNKAGLMVYYKMPGDICENMSSGSKENREVYIPQQIFSAYEGVTFCECCHRLDRPVAGLVVLSRKPQLIQLVQKALAADNACKTYYAIVEGVHEESNEFQLLENYLVYRSSKQKSFIARKSDRGANLARLLWRCNGHSERYSFIEIQLLTGCTHQIRCQLAANNMYIRGDLKYGARRSDSISGIRLYAGKLNFIHPITKEEISIVAPPPAMDGLWTAEWIASGMRTTSPAEGIDV